MYKIINITKCATNDAEIFSGLSEGSWYLGGGGGGETLALVVQWTRLSVVS